MIYLGADQAGRASDEDGVAVEAVDLGGGVDDISFFILFYVMLIFSN